MSIQLENVAIPKGQSFKLFSPRLKHYFYWHHHPEVELAWVEAPSGIRHVGQHVSSYSQSDLLLIGSNIPHLNFDYDLKTDYNQVVVQFAQSFCNSHIPEWQPIEELFNKAIKGLSFYGTTKKEVAVLLQKVLHLNPREQFIQLQEILYLLAESNEFEVLNDRDTSVNTFLKDKIRMASVYDYIHKNYDDNPDVNIIAEQVHLTTPSFCRYFKKQTNMTFTEFVNHYRINQAKTHLIEGLSCSQTAYTVGFSSLAHFSKLFSKMVGVSPNRFKKKVLTTDDKSY